MHSPDDARLRLVRITARADDANEDEYAATMLDATEPAPALAVGGTATTAEASVTLGAKPSATPQPDATASTTQPISGDELELPFKTTVADSRPSSPPARSPWPALAGATLAAMGVVIAYRVITPPSPAPAPMRRAHVIIPNDALAEVDRIPVPVKEGAIEVTGRLGSVHSVRIFRGPLQVRADVCLTEEGVLPRNLDFPSVPSDRGGIPEE